MEIFSTLSVRMILYRVGNKWVVGENLSVPDMYSGRLWWVCKCGFMPRTLVQEFCHLYD